MTRALLITIAVALGLTFSAGAQEGTSLEGRVVDAFTGEGVSEARVRLRSVAGGTRLTAVSGAAGAFQFGGLPPGSYGIQVEHPAYVRGLGRGRSTAMHTVVTVTTGRRQTQVVVRVQPLGSVDGQVLAESGEPLASCTVQLLHTEYDFTERRRVANYSAGTDEQGRFRIPAVDPGSYTLRAHCAPNPVPFRPLLADSADFSGARLGFSPTQMPGQLMVQSGPPTAGLVVQVRESMLYPVTGTVIRPGAADLAATAQVVLLPENADETQIAGAVVLPAKPGFVIESALPGRYKLVAFAKTSDALYTASQMITVGENTPPVTLTLGAGFDVRGVIEVRGTTGAANRRLSGMLLPVERGVFEGRQIQSDAAGAFTVRGVPPGLWRLQLPSPGPDFFLQSIERGATEQTSTVLTVEDEAPLRVIFSDGAGRIDGISREPSGGNALPRTVVIQPVAVSGFLQPQQQATIASADGRFSIGGLPPGRYRVYVLPELETAVAVDPELLRALEPYSTVVIVERSGTANVAATPVPDAAVNAALAAS